jgi:ubiquitin-protein ligase
MSTVRLRRLQADYAKLQDYVRKQPRVRLVQADGDPPERYQLEFRLRSLRRVDDQLKKVDSHLVEVLLPGSYPRLPPQCRMLTPIFHPNIAPHAICIGDHWSAGEPLWSIVARIGEMIAYQSYNTKSPLNGEAAKWVAENEDRLPLDPVSLFVDEDSRPPVPEPRPLPRVQPVHEAPPRPPPAPPPETLMEVTCPGCGGRMSAPVRMAGKRVRCPRCQTIRVLPATT